MNAPVVVVPDGLEPRRPRVSFVFEAVLDHVMRHYANRHVVLAPGNDFGTGRTEQSVAAEYLAGRVAKLTVGESTSTAYVDTRGNARELRVFLADRGLWPLGPIVLAVAFRHARRAALCFSREGYALERVDAVRYPIARHNAIVGRLWYYRHPRIHECYEALALVRDRLRRPGIRPQRHDATYGDGSAAP